MSKPDALAPDELRQAGVALYGAHWVPELAHRLGVAPLTVRRWSRGLHSPPRDLALRLSLLCKRNKADLDLAIARLGNHMMERVDFGRRQV